MLLYHEQLLPIILFSDECRVYSLPDNKSRWILTNDFREEQCAQYSSYKFGTMMWATVGFNLKSKLMFPKGKINEKIYRKCLKDSQIFEQADHIFQQDGATCHTTSKTNKFIERRAKVLYGGPPNSPDLSPIEMLWAILKNRLTDLHPQPTNQAELEECLLILWEGLDQELRNELVLTFHYRLQMCKDVFGASISHFLSSGRKEIRETDIFDREHIAHILSKEQNFHLYELNLKMKNRWKKISNSLKNDFDIPPSSIKSKIIEIERKLSDNKFHPEKYEHIKWTEEYNNISSKYENEIEYEEGEYDEEDEIYEYDYNEEEEEEEIYEYEYIYEEEEEEFCDN